MHPNQQNETTIAINTGLLPYIYSAPNLCDNLTNNDGDIIIANSNSTHAERAKWGQMRWDEWYDRSLKKLITAAACDLICILLSVGCFERWMSLCYWCCYWRPPQSTARKSNLQLPQQPSPGNRHPATTRRLLMAGSNVLRYAPGSSGCHPQRDLHVQRRHCNPWSIYSAHLVCFTILQIGNTRAVNKLATEEISTNKLGYLKRYPSSFLKPRFTFTLPCVEA